MGKITAPIPGVVLDVKVKEGQQVNLHQVVLVLEAMKMENEIVASESGTVTAIHVKTGDSVSVDSVMIEIE
ncbi:MAG TPA: biotin/lipoyl-binding protein [Bacillota bacterium]|nr:biotin/lipoyl-binding protein [Bacillota bacterium]